MFRASAPEPRLIRSTSKRSASLVISITGCSVRVRRGRRPPMPGIVRRRDRDIIGAFKAEIGQCSHHVKSHNAVGNIDGGRGRRLGQKLTRDGISDILPKFAGANMVWCQG